MSLSTTGRTWDEASSPAAVGLSRRFEEAWRRTLAEPSARRPDLAAYLAEAHAQGNPGARLALLRAEMGLRWESGERVGVDDYRARFPDLTGDTLVALVYEEFCLREESGESPDPDEYLTRYAPVASALRRVLDIHGLVGSAGSTAGLAATSTPAVPFPRAGETIAGFRLVEELGRGAFARVFRAEERQLADRPVALKVARNGTREPQTLARLQHTHIVPVHSYRTDPATGLHLLCMPYFGRVTLARLLTEPQVRAARTGAEVVEVLDRLGAGEPPPAGRAPGRAALTRRTYSQAVAWWGARMAEALDHAHQHGILHRDVKPSNVLLTRDGLPMLLDFNLACESRFEGDEADRVPPGGTLDYMAPEHLEELAQGACDRVDARSDVFGLGVLLYEALAGSRPFCTPRDAASACEVLARALESRRVGPPDLRSARPEVPAALASVVARCLEADPDDRYASAAELAADLQAVADDRAPRHAREPLADRAGRLFRTHRRLIAAAVPVALALVVIGVMLVSERVARSRTLTDARALYEAAQGAERDDDFARAMTYYEAAARLAERPHAVELPREIKKRLLALRSGVPGSAWAGLDELRREARLRYRTAELTRKVRGDADAVSDSTDPLRFRLTGFGGDLRAAADELHRVLAPFFVFERESWLRRPDLSLLDQTRRKRLMTEVNELLFLYALALDRDADPRPGQSGPDPVAAAELTSALELCERAREFAQPVGPWDELRERLRQKLARASTGESDPPDAAEPEGSVDETAVADVAPPDEPTSLGCFQWGALRVRQGRRAEAVACFRRAVRLEPDSYWYQYYLAYTYDAVGADLTEALRHYDVAVALKPQSPWVRFSRARLYRVRGAWSLAMDDLQRGLSDFLALPPTSRDEAFERQTRLELGLVRQSLGDLAGAREEYAAVVASDPSGRYARAARLNRAKLEADAGAVGLARKEYDGLLDEEPADHAARLGRALLALRLGHPAEAEADLTRVIESGSTAPGRSEALAFRALARLAAGDAEHALVDADASRRLRPSPWVERLRTRALLALGRGDDLALTSPDDLTRLPVIGTPLRDALRRLADSPAESSLSPTAVRVQLNRAVALSALGQHGAATAAADRAAAQAPQSARVYLVRAHLARYAGRLGEARADAERARELEPDDPRVWELRGRIRIAAGDPSGALADLDRALSLGADGASVHEPRAIALLALGDPRGAVEDWSRALTHDPENALAYLGRAEAFARLRQWDPAIADLEQAAGWSEGQPGVRLRIALEYARCLSQNPARLPRLLSMLRRARVGLPAT